MTSYLDLLVVDTDRCKLEQKKAEIPASSQWRESVSITQPSIFKLQVRTVLFMLLAADPCHSGTKFQRPVGEGPLLSGVCSRSILGSHGITLSATFNT
jgi:hypothetical protein